MRRDENDVLERIIRLLRKNLRNLMLTEEVRDFFIKPSPAVKEFLKIRKYINEATCKHVIWDALEQEGYLVRPEFELPSDKRVDIVAYKDAKVIAIEVKGREEEFWNSELYLRLKELVESGFFNQVYIAIPEALEKHVMSSYFYALKKKKVGLIVITNTGLKIIEGKKLYRYTDKAIDDISRYIRDKEEGNIDEETLKHALWVHLIKKQSNAIVEAPLNSGSLDILEVKDFKSACQAICDGTDIIGYEVKTKATSNLKNQIFRYTFKYCMLESGSSIHLSPYSKFYLVIPSNSSMISRFKSICSGLNIGLISIDIRSDKDIEPTYHLEPKNIRPNVCLVLKLRRTQWILKTTDHWFKPIQYKVTRIRTVLHKVLEDEEEREKYEVLRGNDYCIRDLIRKVAMKELNITEECLRKIICKLIPPHRTDGIPFFLS